ncbi:hypothetical protein AMR72_10095 [Flavobacterium psychrophilum]|nr:hypothetical protein AMR72_10095 [Flavobacterium psychrophilum]AOE52828.1 hypothetical protein ALW18_10085 [Flavobacterium psychrophilum]
MIGKLKRFIHSPDKKTLLKNFFSLSVLQGLNLVLPLLTYPYLIRVLGVDNLGLLFFATALITYFQVLTDYSFNMTATKDIAVNIDDKQKLQEIFNDVFSSKMFLLGLSFIILCVLLLFVPYFQKNRLIYLLTFGNIIGLSLFPVWFFQGIQKMKYITYINFFSKIVFTAAIFVFVKKSEDVWMAPLFTALGYITAGILSLFYLIKDFKIRIQRQSFIRVKEQIIMGRYLFLSELKITLFTNTNVILLGFIAGNAAVGYFSSAEKLVRAAGNFYTPFTLALFPYMSKEMHNDTIGAYRSVVKISKAGTLLFLVFLVPAYIFSEEIITLVYGNEMQNSVLIFRILLFIPIASFLDNMFGKQILLNLGKDKYYFNVILAATVCNIILNVFLTYYYSYKGTAVSLVVTQLIIDVGMYYYARREINRYKLTIQDA